MDWKGKYGHSVYVLIAVVLSLFAEKFFLFWVLCYQRKPEQIRILQYVTHNRDWKGKKFNMVKGDDVIYSNRSVLSVKEWYEESYALRHLVKEKSYF